MTELFLDWTGEDARLAAEVARDLVGARSSLPPGQWSEGAPECGLFFEYLNSACRRAADDPSFLWYLVGSLAGHAYLFGTLAPGPAVDGLQAALDVARKANEGTGWVL